MGRYARDDARRIAAVFVESDETIVAENQLCPRRVRRLLLQIGGTNMAAGDRRFVVAHSVVA